MANEYSPAFFWSPDGTKLLSLLPEVAPGRIWFRWGVWEDGSSFSTGRFVPSLEFSRDYLQFFEQYAQSMRLWSPDGSAFVYAGEEESGGSGIWIQPATQGRRARPPGRRRGRVLVARLAGEHAAQSLEDDAGELSGTAEERRVIASDLDELDAESFAPCTGSTPR